MVIKNREKHFNCPKCEANITIHLSEIVSDKELVDKLNQKKPPHADCKKFGHQWENRTGYEINYIRYVCRLCGQGVTFTTESDEKIGLIDERVSLEIGVANRNLELSRDVEYFFHSHNNKGFTIKDFLKFYKELRLSAQIVDLKAFVDSVSSILDILIEYGYVQLQTPHNDPLKRVYIRKYQLS